MEIAMESVDAAEVVKRQLDAYNARDIEAFMANWADDAQMFAWPSDLLAEGATVIRARHVERFKDDKLCARLVSRVAVGNLVIDREVVTRQFPEGFGTADVIGIYEVEDGKIAKAWFKQGEPAIEGR